MKYYYFNLPKGNDKPKVIDDLRKNISISTAIQKTAEGAFLPFEEYLKNAIDNLKKKDDVKANWKRIDKQDTAELKLIGHLYDIPIEKNRYKLFADENFQPDFEEPLIYKVNGIKYKLSVSHRQWEMGFIEINDRIEKFDSASWGGESIHLELMNNPQRCNVGTTISEDGSRYIIYVDNSEIKLLPENKKEIQGDKLSTFIDNLKYENGETFENERDNLSVTIRNDNDLNKIVVSNNGLKFKIVHPNKRDKDSFWIQLTEIANGVQTDEDQLFSPLRYFFDDDVEIKDSVGNLYEVADGRENENKIVLRKKGGKKYDYCFPAAEQGKEGSVLTVKVNVYQLEKQLEAITSLKNMPIGAHAKLIKLFENRNRTEWSPSDPLPEGINWEVLTDERDGCKKQRHFVQQALATQDFAILEGPPGSGKTTVILELICQIIKQKKRILLCGSTHVAIDNVLERLKEKRLLEKYTILPVRIGDENRINDDVKNFQIDNLVNENNIDVNFLLDAANLVCGTTIGILRNPKFRNRKKNSPILPEFDYLIIDESSKTTFHEFLVPALYAKKWILAGDVMQLSPFTDRSEIVSNISQVKDGDKPLDINLQQAVFYLQKLKKCVSNKNCKYILPLNFETLVHIQQEIEARENDFGNRLIYILHNENINEVSKLELCSFDFIFIDKKLLNNYWDLLPETHAVLLSNSWQGTQHAFEHNAWQKFHKFQYREKGNDLDNSFEIVEELNKYFYEKNWAEEIAWRIDREHQLRLAKGNTKSKSYSEQIDDLIPKTGNSEIITDNINQIAAMAFPSILESLTYGIKGRKNNVESTISEGFKEFDLRKRRETLEYQQRMHPEISRFPRERFYADSNALQDSHNINREWDYSCYANRSVWIDVKGKTERNYNITEVDELAKHLERFIDYAKKHQQPEGKSWTIACLTFYRGQETKIREKLRKITEKENAYSDFSIENGKINIKLHTVDKFQGHEADIVFLSMVQTKRDGFLDNPNRLNVAITRAKFQLVVLGDYNYFCKSKSEDLQELAKGIYIQRNYENNH